MSEITIGRLKNHLLIQFLGQNFTFKGLLAFLVTVFQSISEVHVLTDEIEVVFGVLVAHFY